MVVDLYESAGAAAQKTVVEDVEIIGRMAQRYGDDMIARVLNMLGPKTGKGNRWTVLRVRAARTRAGIAGQSRTKGDSEVFTVGSRGDQALGARVRGGAEGSQETETDRQGRA